MNQDALSITVFVYSMICLFSFVNVTYVRDFDALQINIVPIALSLMAMSQLHYAETYEFCKVGLLVALIADSYFAIRYQESSDNIEFNNFELFAQESWTSGAFNKTYQIGLQIFGGAFIFAQIFFTLAAATNGQYFQGIILAFYIARLVQYLMNTMKGVEMFQSNMVCVLLAVISFNHISEFNIGALQSLFLILDAYIGTVLFIVKKNIHVSLFDSMNFGQSAKIARRIRLVDNV